MRRETSPKLNSSGNHGVPAGARLAVAHNRYRVAARATGAPAALLALAQRLGPETRQVSHDSPTPEEAAALVMAHLQGSAQAVGQQDIDGVIGCLDACVGLYVRHPSYVNEPGSLLRELLVGIRAARSVCKTLRRPDQDLQAIEARAERLRQANLH